MEKKAKLRLRISPVSVWRRILKAASAGTKAKSPVAKRQVRSTIVKMIKHTARKSGARKMARVVPAAVAAGIATGAGGAGALQALRKKKRKGLGYWKEKGVGTKSLIETVSKKRREELAKKLKKK